MAELTGKEKVNKAKIAIRFDKSTQFFSYLLSTIKVIESTEVDTMTVFSRGEIHFSPTFVQKLSDDEVKYVLCHEIMHIVLGHLYRKKCPDRNRYNIACDIKVNNILNQEHIGRIPSGAINPLYGMVQWGNQWIINIDKKTTEQIYEELIQNNNEEDKSSTESGRQPGDEQFDNHEFEPITDEQAKEIEKNIYTAMSTQAGFKSSELNRIWKNIREPIVDWRIVLQKHIQPYLNDSYSWMKLNRKVLSQNMMLPGFVKSEQVKGIFVIDTSGSMTKEMLNNVVSEVQGLLNSFRALEITLLIGDYRLKSSYDMRKDFDINEIQMKGGGGTSHSFMYEYMEEHNPRFCICFTDGESDIEECHNRYDYSTDIIFLSPEGTRNLSLYGEQIWME